MHCMLSVSKLLGGPNFVILQKCCVAPFDQHFFVNLFFAQCSGLELMVVKHQQNNSESKL